MRVPAGRSIVDRRRRGRSRPRRAASRGPQTASAPTTAPQQARHAADHEHRERDEGQIEVERVGADRQQVHVEPAGEPCQGAREGERHEPLPVDGDPDRAGRGGIVPRRAQLPPEPASLVRERGGDRRASAPIVACSRPVVSGTERERRSAPGPIFVRVAEDVVRDLEHGERRDAGREPREAHQRRARRGARTPRRPRAASASDGTLPTVVSREEARTRFGIVAGFSSLGTERTPAAHAPTATKLMCPNESDARVADEDVERDHDRDRRRAR